MAEFKSWRSFWEFEQAIAHRARYVRDGETEGFLETVRQTAERRIFVLPPETFLWRSQPGNDSEPVIGEKGLSLGSLPCPLGRDRMKPPRDRATEGRANPKGISCLYLATSQETASSEVRPWIGENVSVGLFKTCRELRVVKCMTDRGADHLSRYLFSEAEPPAGEREEAVWICIDQAFARPVARDDDVADYAPSQIIAEFFKVQKYDGIAYRSSVSDTGHNVALFDLDAANLVQCHLFRVMSIKCESKEVAVPVQYG
jgi:hypothetical protein